METRIYADSEVLQGAVTYFGGNETAADVWKNRYALRNASGEYLESSPADTLWRVSRELARVEAGYANPMAVEDIYALLDHFRYVVPSSRMLSRVGNPYRFSSLCSSFVIGLEGKADSYGAIMKLDEEQMQLMKRNCSVGHDLSQIRPKGSNVNNTSMKAGGVATFMEHYGNITNELSRNEHWGELMQTLTVKHPDALSFLKAKMEDGRAYGSNIALRLTDDFVNAALRKKNFSQAFPVGSPNPLLKREVDAQELWQSVTGYVWKTSNPSVYFWDRITKENISDCYARNGFRSVSVTPRGGVPMSAYTSCPNMYMNLSAYVQNAFMPDARVDYEKLAEHTVKAMRLMDDLVDLENEQIDGILEKIYNDPENSEIKRCERLMWENIRQHNKEARCVGLGVIGLADMLAKLGNMTIDGLEAEVEKVQKCICKAAFGASTGLAVERGAFPLYKAEKEEKSDFLKRLGEADGALMEKMRECGRRNMSCLSITTTGASAILAQTSNGIEPVYEPASMEADDDEGENADTFDRQGRPAGRVVYHPCFREWLAVTGYDPERKYTSTELKGLIYESPFYRIESQNVNWQKRIELISAVQRWVDGMVCATINVPEETTPEETALIMSEAWKQGCKGCKIYRKGATSDVMYSGAGNGGIEAGTVPPVVMTHGQRPDVLDGDVVRFQNNKERWIAFVGLLHGRPYEIFTGLNDDDNISIPKGVTAGKIVRNVDESGRKRYDFQYTTRRGYKTTIEGLSFRFNPEYWNYAKLISGVLRYGMPIDQVIRLVQGLQLGGESINNWKNGVVRALKKYQGGQSETEEPVCPHCGYRPLRFQEGCVHCPHCGLTRCG